MGFLLLTYYDTMRYWQSIYFIPHILILVFIVIGFVGKCKTKSKTKEATKKDLPSESNILSSGDTKHVKND